LLSFRRIEIFRKEEVRILSASESFASILKLGLGVAKLGKGSIPIHSNNPITILRK
jgi:hypothetical protein